LNRLSGIAAAWILATIFGAGSPPDCRAEKIIREAAFIPTAPAGHPMQHNDGLFARKRLEFSKVEVWKSTRRSDLIELLQESSVPSSVIEQATSPAHLVCLSQIANCWLIVDGDLKSLLAPHQKSIAMTIREEFPNLIQTQLGWRTVPPDTQKQILDQLLHHDTSPRASLVKLEVQRGDDLRAIAEKYAFGRDPAAVERYLRLRLGSADSVQVPLENILPRFIRTHINTYAPCDGMNCATTALNAHRNDPAKVELVETSQEDLKKALSTGYQKIGRRHRPQSRQLG
jgi:hypothetical protein